MVDVPHGIVGRATIVCKFLAEENCWLEKYAIVIALQVSTVT